MTGNQSRISPGLTPTPCWRDLSQAFKISPRGSLLCGPSGRDSGLGVRRVSQPGTWHHEHLPVPSCFVGPTMDLHWLGRVCLYRWSTVAVCSAPGEEIGGKPGDGLMSSHLAQSFAPCPSSRPLGTLVISLQQLQSAGHLVLSEALVDERLQVSPVSATSLPFSNPEMLPDRGFELAERKS